MIAPRPIELLGGALVLTGLLAFFLIDTDEQSWGPDCTGLECPPVEWYDRPATVQALLVIVGFFGLGLLMWGFIQRERRDAP